MCLRTPEGVWKAVVGEL